MARITLIRILVLVVLMTVPVAGVAAVGQPMSSPQPPGQTDSGPAAVVGPVASKISYQSRLVDGSGVPLSGNYNLVFQLWNDANAGSQVGGDIVKSNVPVSNGLLAVELDVPQDAFDGQALWRRWRRCGTG